MSLDIGTIRHEVIPCPLKVRSNPGAFSITPETSIEADGASLEVGEYLAGVLHIQKGNKSTSGGRIVLSLDSARTQLGAEGYTLSITPSAVEIRASHRAGLFYACQTLLQLLPNGRTLACAEIEDRPRFRWRGVMLDVARHFFSKEFIKRTIDLLAMYKMNRLHLHLTDAQAWRLEIKKYPLLTRPLDRKAFPAMWEGHYSQEDIREIVSYAGARQVMVVPEIEFPGHSDAVMAAYPELLCPTHHTSHEGGGNHKEYCTGSEKVFDFVDGVFSEVVTLFDAPFIHIGGDEYMGTSWEKCPDCRRRIEVEGLDREDTRELETLFSKCLGSHKKYLLYRYMMRRIARMVVDRNRIPILWDDLSWQGDYPEKSMVVQWHYQGLFDYANKATTVCNPATQAALAGHDVIVASATHLYFDYFDGGRLIKRLYEFEPEPEDIGGNSEQHFAGLQACLWEHPQKKVDGMLFPRLLAVAETGWTDKSLRTWDDFSTRLESHLPRLDRLGVRYAHTEEIATNGLTEQWKFSASLFKDWLINHCMTGAGTYEVRVEFLQGKATISGALWTDDGHEKPLEPFKSKADGSKIYRFDILDFKPDGLYSVRLIFEGDTKAECQVKCTVRFLSGTTK
jgi:hexosaminidase